MSHKDGKVEYVKLDRVPTRQERRWMADRAQAGGSMSARDMTLLLPEIKRRLDTLQGKELGRRDLGAPPVSPQRWLRWQVGIGVLRRAEHEDPYASMSLRQIRDDISAKNKNAGLSMSPDEVSQAAFDAFQLAQKRNKERSLRQFFGPLYKPRKQRPVQQDFGGGRTRLEPLDLRNVADMKGGRTVRAATGGGRPGDFADAEQGTPPAEKSASARLRSTVSTGRAEQAAYRAIQKDFYAKHGRSMDEDTAWLRAGMKTGTLSRESALKWGRAIRQERDMALARRLAAEEVAGMPRDPQGFIVPRETDPFVRYETWDLRRAAVQSMLNATGRGADAEFTPAQKMFLSHKYGLAPQVSLHESYRQVPGTGHGPQGTFDKGGAKSFRLVPEGHVIDVDTGSVYSETDSRVAFSRSSIARAQDQGVLNRISPVTLMHNLVHPGVGSDSVKTQVFVSPEEYNLRVGGGSVTWAERTGRYTPMEDEFADPNWRHFRDAGERYPGDFVPQLAVARRRTRPAQNPLVGLGPFEGLPTAKRTGVAPRLRRTNPGAFIEHQLPGTARTRLKEEKIHGK